MIVVSRACCRKCIRNDYTVWSYALFLCSRLAYPKLLAEFRLNWLLENARLKLSVNFDFSPYRHITPCSLQLKYNRISCTLLIAEKTWDIYHRPLEVLYTPVLTLSMHYTFLKYNPISCTLLIAEKTWDISHRPLELLYTPM